MLGLVIIKVEVRIVPTAWDHCGNQVLSVRKGL